MDKEIKCMYCSVILKCNKLFICMGIESGICNYCKEKEVIKNE